MSSVLIIAEAGVNHNGSLELAKKLIDAAAETGADIVKFQTFKAEALASKEASQAEYQKKNIGTNGDNSQLNMLKKLELNREDHLTLIDYCKQKNIRFFSTAFDLESIELLHELNLGLWKIPSGEITNLPYLKKIASYKEPVILSTGMCTIDEVGEAVQVLTSNGISKDNLTILHCNTEYPTPMEDVNLKAMNEMQKKFDCEVGYSDHTNGIEIPIAAVALGAMVIEKHFTLDRSMEGPDHKASLEPHELKAMVSAIRNIEKALGNGIKEPSASEQKNMAIARKSIHLKNDLKAGHIIEENDLVMKRPGNGISPMRMNEVVGKKTNKSLAADSILTLEDIN